MNQLSEDNWNKFVIENSSPASFLQSWQWGEFQKALGQKVYRFKIQDLVQAQVIVKRLPAGRTYLEVAKGPVLNIAASDKRLAIGELTKKLKEISKQERAVLARISLPYPVAFLSPGGRGKGEGEFLSNLGFRKPEILVRQLEPENTVLVDLRKSEEELMSNMHDKARYNIRLAERKGVKVRIATNENPAFEKFLGLLAETTKRDKIVSWPRERFLKFREIFMMPPHLASHTEGGSPKAELLVGGLEGRVLAAAIIMLFGDAGTYLYAASSGEERTANAPSLVLWEAIRLAKARGRQWYDMWGIAPQNEPNHPWAGITRFKSRYVNLGVTGRELIGLGTHDLILDRGFHNLFRIYKFFRG